MKEELNRLYWQWVAKQREKGDWSETLFSQKSNGEGWIIDEDGEMVAVWDDEGEGVEVLKELISPKVLIWRRNLTQEHLHICYPNLYRQFQGDMQRQGIDDYSSYNCFSVKLENGKPIQYVIG